ncbi:RNA polymerase sigma factor [Actinoallomurus sp. CA-150999]|uniref:RNA polymerase sigma factor n=1 Tax=Actinoallomurus sp. CA-150999 TaxID=3239887 RepID=UPI003D91413D
MSDEDEADRFTALFRRYHARILAYALRRTEEGHAEDVVAETFTAAWRHIGRLPDDPLPWLYRTAHNCLANQRRSVRRQVRLAGRVAGHLAAGHLEVPDHATGVVEDVQLRAALAELAPRDRETLLLLSWEGLDHRSAAYVTGCSVTAFKVRAHRARKRLAALLDGPPVRGSAAPAAVRTQRSEESR